MKKGIGIMAAGWLSESAVVDKWLKVAETDKSAIPAEEFADAALSLISVFDLINGMSIPKADMVGNANTVKKLAASTPGSTLQGLINSECDGKSEKEIAAMADNGKTAVCALLWLTRALFFILKLMEPLVKEPTLKLSEGVLKGYDVSLKPHHGMMMKGTFQMIVKAAPNRDAFMKKLGNSDEEVVSQVNRVLPAVEGLLDAIKQLLASKHPSKLISYA